LHFLQRHRPNTPPNIRLTEKDEAACRRLKEASGLSPEAAKNQSFHDELDWLTEEDNLVLLVDPFGCVSSYNTARGGDDGLIDHRTIRDILNRCAGKERAIVSLWWGFGQALRGHH